jgi:hypothetical protein
MSSLFPRLKSGAEPAARKIEAWIDPTKNFCSREVARVCAFLEIPAEVG